MIHYKNPLRFFFLQLIQCQWGKDTLHTQPPSKTGVTENEGKPDFLFNEIDEALNERDPIKSTATKGSFRSTPNLNSYPFKTPTELGKHPR